MVLIDLESSYPIISSNPSRRDSCFKFREVILANVHSAIETEVSLIILNVREDSLTPEKSSNIAIAMLAKLPRVCWSPSSEEKLSIKVSLCG